MYQRDRETIAFARPDLAVAGTGSLSAVPVVDKASNEGCVLVDVYGRDRRKSCGVIKVSAAVLDNRRRKSGDDAVLRRYPING